MSRIELLSDEIINQIAAGEIIERPASIIKELVENSIDANSTAIRIFIQNGGKRKIVIEDDGDGIDPQDFHMALRRHATSKLKSNNFFDIASYGFRGEALASIAAISRLTLESRGCKIISEFSKESDVSSSSVQIGTTIGVEGLFERLPARLKFLKSDNIEQTRILEIVENFALTRPHIDFVLQDEKQQLLNFTSRDLDERVRQIMGNDPVDRAIFIEESDKILKLHGYLFHPIDSKYSQNSQKIFVNTRIVQDRTVAAALRKAFRDLLPAGRFAWAVLFLEVNPFYLDINVSPTKSEIRFRDQAFIQNLLTNMIQKNLNRFDRVPMGVSNTKIFQPLPPAAPMPDAQYSQTQDEDIQAQRPLVFHDVSVDARPRAGQGAEESLPIVIDLRDEPMPETSAVPLIKEEKQSCFFGEPIGQLLETYIICKTESELVIIDQHAVHEKITMHKILQNINMKNKQYLSTLYEISLTQAQLSMVHEVQEYLEDCGFEIKLEHDKIEVLTMPSVFDLKDIEPFLRDLLDDQELLGTASPKDMIRLRIANKACHNSIRAGRILTISEMRSIIEEMEATPSIHQCNHHRPTFIKLNKAQLDSIFERS